MAGAKPQKKHQDSPQMPPRTVRRGAAVEAWLPVGRACCPQLQDACRPATRGENTWMVSPWATRTIILLRYSSSSDVTTPTARVATLDACEIGTVGSVSGDQQQLQVQWRSGPLARDLVSPVCTFNSSCFM